MAAARPAVVGGFVLGGLVLGVVAILLFGSVRLFSATFRTVVFFRGSVAGLAVGAPVTFRGVRVGVVRDIRLQLDAKDLTAQIPVYLDLDPAAVSIENGPLASDGTGFKRLLDAGLRAQINAQSFVTGQLQVDLDLRPDAPGQLAGAGPAGVPEIPTIPSALQDLKDKVQGLPLRETVDEARHALASVQRVTDLLAEKIGPISDSLEKTSDAARATLESSSEAVRKVQADADQALVDIDKLAIEGRQQLADRGGELGKMLVATDRAVRKAETLAASLDDLTSPRSQTRGNLDAAIRDLAASASSLRNFSREVERNPSSILTGRTGQ